MDKRPFDIEVALARIEEAVRPWPKAALFQLAEEGFTSVFEQLLACIVSIRTFDEVTLPVSRRLFARARTRSPAAMMLTTDLSMRMDPIYGPISKRFHEHPEELADALAGAWFKLLHRDMGPLSRYLGPWVPEPQL